MEKWLIYNKKNNFNRIKDFNNLTNIQKIILANRDVIDEKELIFFTEKSIKLLHNPFLLKDMDRAVDILMDAIFNGEKIRIVGDYDQDGVASTTILYKGLNLFYDQISYQIPDRIEDGYGLNMGIIDDCKSEGISLIITCDNGISCYDEIIYARKLGIRVIITDHHQVPIKDGKEIIPMASAVVNPSQSRCEYPYKKICGALVAYKFIYAIYLKYGDDLDINQDDILDLLQYACLGTVSDVMELRDENRIVVIEGLKILNKKPNKGLKILLDELNWIKQIDIYTIGFIIAPIVNATGRLFTAKLGVELFLENDENTLREYARELISLNNERKEMTKNSVDRIFSLIDKNNVIDDIIVIYDNKIHESICGLVAGRVKEIYNRPALILTDAQEDGVIKGSGRSIEAYNMHKNLTKLNNFFLAFGGHKMACGLSMKKNNFDEFKKNLLLNSNLKEDDFTKQISIDYPLAFNNISFNIVTEINELQPFGQGFSKPKFATKNVEIGKVKVLGKNQNVVKFTLLDKGYDLEAISFDLDKSLFYLAKKYKIDNIFKNIDNLLGKSCDIVYNIAINEFNGRENIQLNIEYMR